MRLTPKLYLFRGEDEKNGSGAVLIQPFELLKLHNKETNEYVRAGEYAFLVDTGSSVTFLDEKFAAKEGMKKQKIQSLTLVDFGGENSEWEGENSLTEDFYIEAELEGKSKSLQLRAVLIDLSAAIGGFQSSGIKNIVGILGLDDMIKFPMCFPYMAGLTEVEKIIL